VQQKKWSPHGSSFGPRLQVQAVPMSEGGKIGRRSLRFSIKLKRSLGVRRVLMCRFRLSRGLLERGESSEGSTACSSGVAVALKLFSLSVIALV